MHEHWSNIIFYPVWNHITAHIWLYVCIFFGLCLIENFTNTDEMPKNDKYKNNKILKTIHNITLCLLVIPIGLFLFLFMLLHFGGILFEHLQTLWKVPGIIGLFLGMLIMFIIMTCRKNKQ